MLKKILLDTLDEIKSREERTPQILTQCVADRLEKSLSYYEDNLMATCKYILSRNPVIMMKDMNKIAEEQKDE